MRRMIDYKKLKEYINSVKGIKLYQHAIYDSESNYQISVITSSKEPIDFSIYNTYELLINYLRYKNYIAIFMTTTRLPVFYDDNKNWFVAFKYAYEDGDYTLYIEEIDELNLSTCSDTVIEL